MYHVKGVENYSKLNLSSDAGEDVIHVVYEEWLCKRKLHEVREKNWSFSFLIDKLYLASNLEKKIPIKVGRVCKTPRIP